MYLMPFKKYCIEDFEKEQIGIKPIDRSQISIAIIDDEEFMYKEQLLGHDFRFTQFEDIDSVKQLETFHIIVCDIKGVGKKFKSDLEGAWLIKEIRKTYPHKILFAYSGHSFKTIYNEYFNMCDEVLNKDMSSDDWIDYLDNAIKDNSDPIRIWRKLRTKLVENNISTESLTKVEDSFVRSFLSESDFPNQKLIPSLSSDSKSIINSLVANVIFKIVAG